MNSQDFVYADEYGFKGTNFYWINYERYNLTFEQLRGAGVENDRVVIHKNLVKPLKDAQEYFEKDGFEIYIKDGLRPAALYKLIYDTRSEIYGKETVDKILNIHDMPHSTGRAVDLALMDGEGREVVMRDKKDDPAALIIDFYKDRHDEKGQQFHKLQLYMMGVMFKCGFRLGKLREYFHFNYEPNIPENY